MDALPLDLSDADADADADAEPVDLRSPSPSISAAADVPDAGTEDSGYESSDSLPSLLTIEDSSDEDHEDRHYFSDSSEDPESDPEEDAMIAEGFVVDEEVSDLDV